jgi:hypothetical protein
MDVQACGRDKERLRKNERFLPLLGAETYRVWPVLEWQHFRVAGFH